MASDLELFPRALPPGVERVLDAVDADLEQALAALRAHLPLEPYVMRGQASRRRLAAFGHGYRGAFTGPEPPSELVEARRRVAAATGRDPEPFVQIIYTVYPPGAGIGWHVDLERFGPEILGLSLLSAADLRFRPRSRRLEPVPVRLPPRSAYVIGGEARATWEHHLPPVKTTRVSLTFRTMGGSHGRRST
jgi:alkylated DNA repair dioxygenase AlkB